eukprot:GEMP01063771.1.p1 GENE.GEMP01063771.1~~GEMP01063771.1.p1  ORF type:complete len:325 (+),score=70.46 GEMP01063771.1:36-1010(+)
MIRPAMVLRWQRQSAPLVARWCSTASSTTTTASTASSVTSSIDDLLAKARNHFVEKEFDDCVEVNRSLAKLIGELPSKDQTTHWLKVCAAHVNSAYVLKILHRLEEAEQAALEGVQLFEKHFSQHKQQTAEAYELLCEICLLQRKTKEAEQHVTRALTIKTSYLPANDQKLTATVNLSGQAMQQRGNYDDAKDMFVKALNLNIANPLPSAAGVALNNYAGVLQDQGRFAESVPIYEKVVDIFTENHGEHELHSIQAFAELGAAAFRAELPHISVPALQKSLVLHGAHFGLQHPSTQSVLEMLVQQKGIANGRSASIDEGKFPGE